MSHSDKKRLPQVMSSCEERDSAWIDWGVLHRAWLQMTSHLNDPQSPYFRSYKSQTFTSVQMEFQVNRVECVLLTE